MVQEKRSRTFNTGCPGAALLLSAMIASGVNAQVRNMPVFFEPAYAWDKRAGIDAAHFGEADGTTVTASGTWQFWIGNCRRLSVSGAAGIMNPGGPADARFTSAIGAQVLLNPCPSVLSVSAVTFRFVTGAGVVHGEDVTAWNVPIGVGVGWKLPIAVVQLEPWFVPHAVYRDPLGSGDPPVNAPASRSRPGHWTGALSAGVTAGLGEVAGLRIGATCCRGGVGLAYGVSLWF